MTILIPTLGRTARTGLSRTRVRAVVRKELRDYRRNRFIMATMAITDITATTPTTQATTTTAIALVIAKMGRTDSAITISSSEARPRRLLSHKP